MAMSKPKKTYQYVMTEDECQLFNLLRRLEDEGIDLFAVNDDPRLYEIQSVYACKNALTWNQ
jgi:hypothetical protein